MNTLEPTSWDPLHSHSDPQLHWTTSNVGEAVPGVMTPLCSSIWVPAGELGLRRACHQLGIVTRAEADLPPEDLRWVRA